MKFFGVVWGFGLQQQFLDVDCELVVATQRFCAFRSGSEDPDHARVGIWVEDEDASVWFRSAHKPTAGFLSCVVQLSRALGSGSQKASKSSSRLYL